MRSVTVALLIYKSPEWLAYVLEGLAWARNVTPYRTLVVGNDANEEVMATGRVDVDFRNADPNEYYLNRVYRAWNKAVESAETDWVILINSDMYVSDWWIDELVAAKEANPKSLPCSLLVESGRIPSAMPEYVHNFGTTVDDFDRDGWALHARSLHERGFRLTEPGRLYMPVLVDKREFLEVGGYPEGNRTELDGSVTSGDKILFQRYQDAGYTWVTCLGSVVFHTQEGEMRS